MNAKCFWPLIRGDYFRFGSVFTYKNNQTEFFYFKKSKLNRNRVKPTGFDSIRLFYIKNKKLYCFWFFFFVISNWFGFGLARFFSVLVWFGFSVSSLWNQNQNQTGWFLKYSNQFNWLVFLFFLLTPTFNWYIYLNWSLNFQWDWI